MATAVVDRLGQLYERDGKLTAESVLFDAMDPASPLHDRFEWDDTIAAHQYRMVQAQEIVRLAETTVMEHPVRNFVFLKSQNSYAPIRHAMSKKDWREEIVAEFKADADRFEARWANHKFVADHYAEWRRKGSTP